MGIELTKSNKVPDYSGFMRKVLLMAPFLQLLLWLNSLEAFIFWGLNDSAYDFFILLAFSFGVYFLVRIFFLIAKKWQKWMMYFFFALIGLQTGVGLIYKYYQPNQEEYSNEELFKIKKFLVNEEELPANMEILDWNDSIAIIGKKVKQGAWGYGYNFNELIVDKDLLIKGGKTYYYNKYSPPRDFNQYKLLVEPDLAEEGSLTYYWCWQYPMHLIYIYIKDVNCKGFENRDIEPCYKCFSKVFVRGLDRFKPILREIIEGRLDDRYRNFYKFFQKLANPTYVRSNLANDPYFLIYQGKYQEAREGLKDLPPARREFCEKKLEALGY
ncbi:hypothetical protein [Saccharicrinis aurantiacus]|uniref:hypothetical protein n=1 Tax=Saccharicrinis aurantiacus TaxID=1849719 RepID=UPI000950004E|nr:hypothetical protein [Saccharicrinis aurantiacus]